MPFKTKKHKIRAIKRRISISEKGLASYIIEKKTVDVLENSDREVDSSNTKLLLTDYKYLRSDMIKTVLIATVIIGLQLIIKLSRITP